MNLTSPSDVRKLLDELGIRPNKVLGQNFLVDRNILNILAETAGLTDTDSVLEVGGGLGVVTELLAEKAGRVTVIEKDRKLAEHLTDKFSDHKHVEIIHADAVDILCVGRKRRNAAEAEALMGRVNKVVANLPYSVGTKLMVDLLKHERRPDLIAVTVQLEVAERFVADVAEKDYGLLSVWSHLHYEVELVKHIKNSCFWPKPEVESGILKMKAHGGPGLSKDTEEILYALTKYAFGHRRKQMTNIMKHVPGGLHMDIDTACDIFDKLGVSLSARPQNLSVADWSRLAEAIEEICR